MASSLESEHDLVDSDDYYAWLGLSKEASKDEINNAFRKLSRIYHPDKHASRPEMSGKAEQLFSKVKKAHHVLSDPHTRAIYDTLGEKGLETDGWEIVSRTKSPQEIIAEYERLEKEREERRLQQSTNPKGSIVVGIDATDFFDRYEALDAMEYRSLFPHIEISNMSISQSVECPLTAKNTGVLSGNLSSRNGRGNGNVAVSGRRVMSHNGWAEIEVSAGDGAALSVRGFRTLWRRSFGTMSGSLQFSPHGGKLRPAFSTMVATQLDKNLQGRLSYNAGTNSAMSTMIVWDTSHHHLSCGIQLGLRSTYMTLSYTRKFVEDDFKIKAAIRAGTSGVVAECGCEKKITKFSVLGASLSVGVPLGVSLRIKLNRGNQSFIFPIHLSDEIAPNALFYGTVVPLAVYFTVNILIVKPFLKDQKNKDLQQKKDANIERMAEKKREAETAVELMLQTVERVLETEESKGGLIVRKALYGKLEGHQINELDVINVTIPIQAQVKDSKLYIPDGTHMSEMPGFYDPCVGEDKELSITYEFRRKLHICLVKDGEKLLLPNREHLVDQTSDTTSHSTLS